MAHLSAPDFRHKDTRNSAIAFNLAVIALLTLLAGLGFAYMLDMARNAGPNAPSLNSQSPIVKKTIAGQRLAIPSEWFRFEAQKTTEFSEQIDLMFALPIGPEGAPAIIDVALMPRSSVRPSNRLLDSVYLHQFLETQLQGPPGLVGKPLRPAEGFQNETVWYDPVSPDPFVAKCMPLIDNPDDATCMRTILVTDQMAATYVFDAKLLYAWKRFDAEAQRWLSRIGGI